uniref:Uncharacterized protein n=1 Tax=Clytia hemisphaerica TaxID=252671 RepID=A0A7M5X7L7_9CNID
MNSRPGTRQSFLPSSVERCTEDINTWGKQSIIPWRKKKMEKPFDESYQGFDDSGKYYTSFCHSLFSDHKISAYSYNEETHKLEASLIKFKASCRVCYDPKTTRWFDYRITQPKLWLDKDDTLEIRSDMFKEYFGTSTKLKSKDVSKDKIVQLSIGYKWGSVYNYLDRWIFKTEKHGKFFIILLRDQDSGTHYLYLFSFDEKGISHFKTITIKDHALYERFNGRNVRQNVFLNFDAGHFYIIGQEKRFNKPVNGESKCYEDYTNSGWMSGFNFEGNKIFMFPIIKQEKEHPHYFQYIAQCNGSQFLVVWLHTLEVEIFDATVDGMIRLKKFPLSMKESDHIPYNPFQILLGKKQLLLSLKYWLMDNGNVVAFYDLDSAKLVFTYEHPHYKMIEYHDLNFETKELFVTRYGGWSKTMLEVSKVEGNFFS